nr:unknown function [Klebsiella phage vB_Kpl_K53PH164C2]
MNHEVKSGEQVIATITARKVLAFQISITGPNDMKTVFVPLWANTVAIDEDGAIWAYESTAEDVRLVPPVPGYPGAWDDCGDSNAEGEQIGCVASAPDWKGSKVDLRDLKLQFLLDSLSAGRA